MNIQTVQLNKIKPDPNQPRQFIDSEGVERLAKTFKSEGIIQPIEITPDYKILVGEMRWRAAKLAGLKEIPCIINDKADYKKADRRLARQLVENEARIAINVMDKARAWQRYIDDGHTQKELIELLGLNSHSVLGEVLGLLSIPQAVQAKLSKDDKNWTYHREVSSLPRVQAEELHGKIFKGDFKTRDELVETVKMVRDNPNIAEKIIGAKTPLERSLAVMSNRVPQRSENKFTQRKGRTLEESEKAIFNALLESLNSVHMAGVLWRRDDATKIVRKYAKAQELVKITKSVETLARVWSEALKGLGK